MPRIEVDRDERYPDYMWSRTLTDPRMQHDVSQETLDRWERVRSEYEAMQDEIEALYDVSIERPRQPRQPSRLNWRYR